MKKVKIMLMSLLVLSVVGGALAFNTKFDSAYCTSAARQVGATFVCINTAGANLLCPNLALNRTVTTQGVPVCVTPLPINGQCDVRCGVNVTFTIAD